jgi:peptidoglycan/LPS O-acetylase OafA/YrhL
MSMQNKMEKQQTPGAAGMTEGWRNSRLVGRIEELDGLRGLAVSMIVIQHYACDAVHSTHTPYLLVPFRLAWSGVDLFFVLSGFLIGGILLDAKKSANYYSTFYSRRVYRIFPIYYLWLALFLVGVYLSAGVRASFVSSLFRQSIPFWTYCIYLQNLGMSLRDSIGPIWLAATWSLAVEEQFYLLLPYIVRQFSRQTVTWLSCFAILCSPVLRFLLMYHGPGYLSSYTLLPCRADSLGFGVLLAIVVRSRVAWDWLQCRRKWMCAFFWMLAAGFCLLILIRHPFTKPLFVALGFSLLAAFYAVSIALLVLQPGPVAKLIFRWKPLVRLGTISYAVYIIHNGVNFLWHGAVFGETPSLDTWPEALVTTASVVTVVVLSSASWHFWESGLIQSAHQRFRYS